LQAQLEEAVAAGVAAQAEMKRLQQVSARSGEPALQTLCKSLRVLSVRCVRFC